MPSQTDDIEFAITIAMNDGEELTLEALNERLYASYPSLRDDPRWIGVAVSKMLSDGRLLPVDWDGKSAFEADRVVQLADA